MLKTLKSLPPFLLLAFWAFALTPLLSLSFLPLPWLLLADASRSHWNIAASVFAFWLGPVALCLTLLRRSVLFLGLFALECAALVVQVMEPVANLSRELMFVRLFLIALVTGIGLLFLTRDAIFPLLQRRNRWWRVNPRMDVNISVTLSIGDRQTVTMLENCSASGMALSCERVAGLSVVGQGRGARGHISLRRSGLSITVPIEVVWYRDDDALLLLGLRALEFAPMQELIRAAAPRLKVSPAAAWISQTWVRTSFQRVMMLLWAAAIVGSIGIPSCGGAKKSNKEDSDAVAGAPVAGGQPGANQTAGHMTPVGVAAGPDGPYDAAPAASSDDDDDDDSEDTAAAVDSKTRVNIYYTQGFKTLRYADDVPTQEDSQGWNPTMTPSRVVNGHALTTDYQTKEVERD